MAKDRLKAPKEQKEPPEPKKTGGGRLVALLFGIVLGAALVVGFLALRNAGTLDEWIEQYPALKFLDDSPADSPKN